MSARKDKTTLLIDTHFHCIDLVFGRENLPCHTTIAVYERTHRVGYLPLDSSAHLKHVVFHIFELSVKLLGNMMGMVFHIRIHSAVLANS